MTEGDFIKNFLQKIYENLYIIIQCNHPAFSEHLLQFNELEIFWLAISCLITASSQNDINLGCNFVMFNLQLSCTYWQMCCLNLNMAVQNVHHSYFLPLFFRLTQQSSVRSNSFHIFSKQFGLQILPPLWSILSVEQTH